MIAIFEPHEVLQLIEVLKWALNGCEGDLNTEGHSTNENSRTDENVD